MAITLKEYSKLLNLTMEVDFSDGKI